MIQYCVFPEGKRRIVTFSFDDGQKGDKRLAEIFRKYGVKGTFHLNSSMYKNMTDEELKERASWYEGQEIACHTYSHLSPTVTSPTALATEVLKDREILERMAGYPVVGMSYPYGQYSEEVIRVMEDCGIVYSRTTGSNPGQRFILPNRFMTWHPSCKHVSAEETIEEFLSKNDPVRSPLLYIWGHSFEFKTEEDWARIEGIVASVSGREDTWYATNIEIYRYMQAVKGLVVSLDEKIIQNPSATDVYIEVDRKEVCIPAGKTVRL